MLILEINNLKKYYGHRLILDIENLKVYSEDRIGIVGLNGSGKSTLLDVITDRIIPEKGNVKLYGSYSYISQRAMVVGQHEFISGGEKAMLKISEAFDKDVNILFADEPTANLDISNIEKFKYMLKGFKGALMMVSHDRELLDSCCTSILEIDEGSVKIYKGNYSEFINQKKAQIERKEFEYSEYIKEKNKLQRAVFEVEGKSSAVKKAPKRMGNSEARLHKMGDQKAKAALDKTKKALRSRLERLEVKEKPRDIEKVKMDFNDNGTIHSKVVIEGVNLSKGFGDKMLFKNLDFKIFNNTRTAIAGCNGCGKTTLIKMIMDREPGISISKAAKPGYFAQDFSILEENKTLLENIMETSINDENFSRRVLSGLLFKRGDVYKKVINLSGGEKIKAALAKIILSDKNLLILDEPTNYLDVYSMEALENVLQEYNGTLIFVSHDIRFVNKLATNLLVFKDNELISFSGNYEQYLENIKISDRGKKELQQQILVLENRMCQIIGRISMPGKNDNLQRLNQEYDIVLQQLRILKLNYNKLEENEN